ncbi:MAG: deoxyribose-phosphate aldolase [Planctomycetota bacterium]
MAEEYQYADLAKMIDHSLLHPTMTTDEMEAGIDLAVAYDVASVCIMPSYLARLSERLSGTGVRSSTVIGFPLGVHTTDAKIAEAEDALRYGAEELDVVCNVSRVLSGDWSYVHDDLAALIELTHAQSQKIKVIFENCYLEDDHKIRLCKICTELGADWVKTSTGFGTGGATMEDLRLMRQHAGDDIQVKAAGGIRDLDSLIEAKEIGASRCGTSKAASLLDPLRERLGLEPIDMKAVSKGDY